MPLMPYVAGTRGEYALALMACGTILSLASFYVMRGELRARPRPLLGDKLLASSVITLLFGLFMLAVSVKYLSRL